MRRPARPFDHVGSRVVAGRDGVAVVEVARPAQQRPELHVAVAVDARAGRLAAEVRGEERPDHPGVELALEVEDVERDPELRGDPPGVLRRVGAAAALPHLGVGVGAVVDAHPDADDVVAGVARGGRRRPTSRRRRTWRRARARRRPQAIRLPSGSAASAADPSRTSASTRGTTATAASTSSSVVARPRREAQRAQGVGLGDAHRGQHVGRLRRAGGAGRPGRAGDPLEVEGDRGGDAVGAADEDGEEAREALGRVARELDAVDREAGRLEAGPQAGEAGAGRRLLGAGEGVGRRHADRSGHVLRPGPPMALLAPAVELGEERRPAPDPQRADALGALELVGGDRDGVGAERGDVEVEVRRRLDGVHVEVDPPPGPDPVGDLRAPAGSSRPRCWPASPPRGSSARRGAASTASGSTRPEPSTGAATTSKPNFSRWCAAWPTAWCSTALTTSRLPRALPAQAAPLTARLLASVPPEVRTISRAAPPRSAASRSCASSRALRAARPAACAEDGLPKAEVRNGQHRLERLGPERRRRGVVEVDRHQGAIVRPSTGRASRPLSAG